MRLVLLCLLFAAPASAQEALISIDRESERAGAFYVGATSATLAGGALAITGVVLSRQMLGNPGDYMLSWVLSGIGGSIAFIGLGLFVPAILHDVRSGERRRRRERRLRLGIGPGSIALSGAF